MARTPNPRVLLAVVDAFDGLRHEFDIKRNDCFADRERWNKVTDELEELLVRAYCRNHNGEPS